MKFSLLLQACSYWCQRTPDCQGWSRNKKSGQCFLITLSEGENSDWAVGRRCEKDDDDKTDINGILYLHATFNYSVDILYF